MPRGRRRVLIALFSQTILFFILHQEWLYFYSANSNTQFAPFAPSWGIREDVVPYMGNLTCPFELAHYNLESHKNPIDREKRRSCGKLRFSPYDGYISPDPTIVFKSLPHNATIYIVGDSISLQTGIDLLCYLSSISEIVRSDITRKPGHIPTAWCANMKQCEVD